MARVVVASRARHEGTKQTIALRRSAPETRQPLHHSPPPPRVRHRSSRVRRRAGRRNGGRGPPPTPVPRVVREARAAAAERRRRAGERARGGRRVPRRRAAQGTTCCPVAVGGGVSRVPRRERGLCGPAWERVVRVPPPVPQGSVGVGAEGVRRPTKVWRRVAVCRGAGRCPRVSEGGGWPSCGVCRFSAFSYEKRRNGRHHIPSTLGPRMPWNLPRRVFCSVLFCPVRFRFILFCSSVLFCSFVACAACCVRCVCCGCAACVAAVLRSVLRAALRCVCFLRSRRATL